MATIKNINPYINYGHISDELIKVQPVKDNYFYPDQYSPMPEMVKQQIKSQYVKIDPRLRAKRAVKPLEKVIPVLNYPEFRYLDRLSLELEGAWYNYREDIHKDLSFSKEDFSPEFESVGEFTSKPFTTFNEWAECLIKNYPDYSCNKCGFHIHFSLKSPAHYMMCMEKGFYDKFLESLKEWGRKNVSPDDYFWARLAGANKYCQNVFIPDTQANYREKGINRLDRRTILNYTYRHLGTIEVRVLPMFKDYNLAISAINNIVNFVEKYISENKNNNIQFNQKVVAEIPVKNCWSLNEKILIKPCNLKMGRYNFFNRNKMIKSLGKNPKINLEAWAEGKVKKAKLDTSYLYKSVLDNEDNEDYEDSAKF